MCNTSPLLTRLPSFDANPKFQGRNTYQRNNRSGHCKAQTKHLVVQSQAEKSSNRADPIMHEVVVIGSGIGGLSSAAMLAAYGVKVHSTLVLHFSRSQQWLTASVVLLSIHFLLQVVVCESHNIPGGAAHAWVKKGYHFESGPSLYSGMASRQSTELILSLGTEPSYLHRTSYTCWVICSWFISRNEHVSAYSEQVMQITGGRRQILSPMCCKLLMSRWTS